MPHFKALHIQLCDGKITVRIILILLSGETLELRINAYRNTTNRSVSSFSKIKSNIVKPIMDEPP
jgi:hypothetical protein